MNQNYQEDAQMSMNQKIADVILSFKPGVDLESSDDFIEDGIIDSFDVIAIVSEFNDAFDVEIGVLDLVPENFKSIETLAAMITRLSDD